MEYLIYLSSFEVNTKKPETNGFLVFVLPVVPIHILTNALLGVLRREDGRDAPDVLLFSRKETS